MPIDSLHPQYQAALPQWTLVSDVLAGEARVKEKGREYLPSLAEQTEEDYAAYRDRALFVNATDRTHESYLGFVFRKDPVIVAPPELQDLIDDATLTGYGFYDYIKDVSRAVLSLGRYGTLVDWDQLTQRPFLRPYQATQIVNWRTGRVGAQVMLTQLVLTEISDEYVGMTGEAAPPDPYVHQEYQQWRVFDLLPDESGAPYVRCQVWRRKQEGTTGSRKGGISGGNRAANASSAAVGADASWIQVSEAYPARRGTPLAAIPFVFHGPNNHQPAVDRVPLENLARINISHYRSSADLENGRHFTGLPTAIAVGFAAGDQKLYLGSTVAWTTETPGADAKFLEFTGQGLGALTTAIAEKQEQMASSGARMFDARRGNGQEAYDTTRIKQTGDTVTLTTAAVALTQSCSRVLQLALWWITPSAAEPEDLDDRASATINTDFVSAKLTSQELTALVGAWQAKAISYETLFFNLQAGEMYPDDTKIDDEAGLIAVPTVDFNLGGNGTNGLTGTAANTGGAGDGTETAGNGTGEYQATADVEN